MARWVCLCALAAGALAQTPASEPAAKRVRAKISVRGGGVPKAELEALRGKLETLIQFVGEAASSQGFEAAGSGRIGPAEDQGRARRSPMLTGSATIVLRHGGGQDGAKDGADELEITVNSTERFLPRHPYLTDAFGPVYVQPAAVGQVAGFPVFRSSVQRGDVIVITKPGRPLFQPVSQERVLRARIEEARRLADELSKIRDAAAAQASGDARQRLAALEEELAGLPETERSAPAYLGSGERPSGLAAGVVAGGELVTLNPDLLDRDGRPSAIRLLTLDQSLIGGDTPEAIRGKVNFKKVLTIVE